MEEQIADKMKRIINERELNIRSKKFKNLTIFEMPEEEYDRFIAFLHSFNPKMQGNEALMLLLEVYDRYKVSDKLIAKLEQEIVELKRQVVDKPEDEKTKKKWIGSE